MNTVNFFKDTGISNYVASALIRYLVDGIEPGGFLKELLSDNHYGAVGLADNTNIQIYGRILVAIKTVCPRESYGSPQQVNEWMNNPYLREQVLKRMYTDMTWKILNDTM